MKVPLNEILDVANPVVIAQIAVPGTTTALELGLEMKHEVIAAPTTAVDNEPKTPTSFPVKAWP